MVGIAEEAGRERVMGRGSKYNSAFFNSERYYDPTAGAALLNVIRGEKKTRYVNSSAYKAPESIEVFAIRFSKYYASNHPEKKSGKPPKYAVPARIRKSIRLYEYCMDHCDEADFTIGGVVERFCLGTAKHVKQCFSNTGDIGKLIDSWNNYKRTGTLSWGRKGEADD